MGVVGGPHCLAMCAAPCHFLTRSESSQVVSIAAADGAASANSIRMNATVATFHFGRLSGYAVVGAVAAKAMEQLAWFSDRTSWLHPIWVMMHVAVLAWGLMLMLQTNQPQWMESAGRWLWKRLQRLITKRSGAFITGMAWGAMPCGLLYSAVMVAALSGSGLNGAVAMMAFGAGSALWLLLAPWIWHQLSGKVVAWRIKWGMRLAGGMLVALSSWAIWVDLLQGPTQWCR